MKEDKKIDKNLTEGCACSGTSHESTEKTESPAPQSSAPCCSCSGPTSSSGITYVGGRSYTGRILLIVLGVLAVGIVLTGLIFGWTVVGGIFDFISTQIISMSWLNSIITAMFNSFSGSDFSSTWYGASTIFFLFDTIKIIILLCTLIFVISYVQSYFPPERSKKILSKFSGIKGNIVGALLGTVTPFCSCSSIPLFIGFTRAGIRSGVTFSFLISSPLVDFGAFILLSGVFGFPIALAYVLVGLVLAVIGGFIIEKTGMGKHVQDFVTDGENVAGESATLSVRDRLIYASKQMTSTLKKVIVYIFIGVGIGALIHNVIPTEWTYAVLGADNPFSVLIATVVGVPMYADIFGTIPVAEGLLYAGVSVGTILSFMMSVTALSLPSLIMLKKVVKTKLLLTFTLIVIVGIIIIGYSFNLFGVFLI